MNVAVPEPCGEASAGTVDDAGILRYLHAIAVSDRDDGPARYDNDRITERGCSWRAVDGAPDQRQGLPSLSPSAGAQRHPEATSCAKHQVAT
jgi:hypothetical protein